MKITSVHSDVNPLPLARPYTIAFRSVDSVQIQSVRLTTDRGPIGTGAASPEPFVTGEDDELCKAHLSPDRLGWLVGEDPRNLTRLCRRLAEETRGAPAARAAVDIALHDLFAQALDLPLVEVLGRVHDRLPTSVTIGILSVEDTLAEAREHQAAGFRVLKIKLGHSLEEDLERLRTVRKELGNQLAIRVDPNQGYSIADLQKFEAETRDLDIEFVEQPVSVASFPDLRTLSPELRRRVAADESILSPADAIALLTPEPACGIFNIKLMKCGGIHAARDIAAIADAAGIELMWGCMDESVISIAGALHAALASPATRFLDLDGSFDLAKDIAEGGFVLEDGYLSTRPEPGLGVRLVG